MLRVGGELMRIVLVMLLCLALAVAACGQQTAPADRYDNQNDNAVPADLPPPPPPPTSVVRNATPAPAGDTHVLDNPLDFGGEPGATVGGFKDISCDAAERRLSFTIVNTGDQRWQLDQDVGFPPPVDLVSGKVFVNNYEVNRRQASQFKDGVKLFGPNEKFSENCGGVEVLAPGEEASCTIYPVPLKSADAGVNRIWLDVPGDIEYVSFTCS